MAKQPFYHRVTILFTATEEIPLEVVEKKLKLLASIKSVVKKSIMVEEYDTPYPGDPADL